MYCTSVLQVQFWGSSIKANDFKKVSRLIKKAGSLLGLDCSELGLDCSGAPRVGCKEKEVAQTSYFTCLTRLIGQTAECFQSEDPLAPL